MTLIVCGINHKTASVALREKFVFPPDKLSLYLTDLREQFGIDEAVLLSTCNRSELYCSSENKDVLLEWFCKQHNVAVDEVRDLFYVHQDLTAIQHIMSVACGLDSLILGESQVLGQMKNAFAESCTVGMIGPLFNRLFQHVFGVAKEIRTNTAIGACPVSVASAAVSLGKQFFKDITHKTVLVIGAGETANLVLRYLRSNQAATILLSNRTHATAEILATIYSAEIIPFHNLTVGLVQADLIISVTGSIQPIITQEMMQTVIENNKKERCLIDIAVPRDIEETINELPLTALYTIDDLKNIINNNLQGREHAAEKAREVISNKSAEFIEWLRSVDMVTTTIKAYRKQIEKISQSELTKAAKQLQQGNDPLQVLVSFSHAFTNKLLHTPSVQLRQAGVEGRFEMLQIAQELFAITE